jgi:hypothetical protein
VIQDGKKIMCDAVPSPPALPCQPVWSGRQEVARADAAQLQLCLGSPYTQCREQLLPGNVMPSFIEGFHTCGSCREVQEGGAGVGAPLGQVPAGMWGWVGGIVVAVAVAVA